MASFRTDGDDMTLYDESDCPELKGISWVIVVLGHFVEFPVALVMMWVIYKRLDTLKLRCFSPLLILLGIGCGAVGTMAEIGAHHYVGNFNLCLYHPNDMVQASFMFFMSALMVGINIGVSKRGRADTSSGILYLLVTFVDIITIAILVAIPFVYGKWGPTFTQNFLFVPNQAVCSIVSAFRIWKNLGPSKATFIGGFGYFGICMVGVAFLAVYKKTGILILHAVIGGNFICSQLGFAYAIYNSQDDYNGSYDVIPH